VFQRSEKLPTSHFFCNIEQITKEVK
jgi:hypothetical protein